MNSTNNSKPSTPLVNAVALEAKENQQRRKNLRTRTQRTNAQTSSGIKNSAFKTPRSPPMINLTTPNFQLGGLVKRKKQRHLGQIEIQTSLRAKRKRMSWKQC